MQEMKFFGAVLSTASLEGLLQGVKEGFTGLRILEFSINLSSHASTQTTTSTSSSNSSGGAETSADVASQVSKTGRRLMARGPRTGLGSGGVAAGPAGASSGEEVAPVRSPAQLAEAIIAVAKDRAYVGKNGLSVTVNYR